MGETYPALDVRGLDARLKPRVPSTQLEREASAERDADLLLAAVDDFSPTAIEERHDLLRVFFARSADRDAARNALAPSFLVSAVDVPDEDWARRSQQNLQPVTIGRLTIFPDPESLPNPKSPIPNPCSIVIAPSMGFGTGHHATTRLCLEALQTIDLAGARVLDVGTGSGVLAIAAVRLGAARAVGIDVDADAIQAARENLTHNPEVSAHVSFAVDDVLSTRVDDERAPDVITANLTGVLLVRSAPKLLETVRPGGALIVSGLQVHEREDVKSALPGATTVWERTADEWVGLVMKKS